MYERYKKRERRVARVCAARLAALCRSSAAAARCAWNWLRGGITVMLVPDDHRRPLQLSLSRGSCLISVSLLLAGTAGFPGLRAKTMDAEARLSSLSAVFRDAAAVNDLLRDEALAMVDAAAPLVEALDGVDAVLRSSAPTERRDMIGPVEFFRDRRRNTDEERRMEELRNALERASVTLLEAGNTLRNQRENLAEIPTGWPLKNGIGHISMYFGYNPNPFTGIPYIHLGLDIGNYRSGDPVVSTADGVVTAAYYDPISGFGNNVIIRHSHGFLTRYGHLQAFRTRVGQNVRRGEIIGVLGNTGKTDGPHVHYEVRLGPDVLDPLSMMTVRPKKGKITL